MPLHDIAIVGHQARMSLAWDLADKVGSRFMAIDTGRIGPGKNHLRAWKHLDRYSDAEWAVVLEDDARPVEGFCDQLTAALKVAPHPIVSLYLGTGRPPHWQDQIAKAVQRPECWIVAPSLLHHVGVAIKRSLLPVMIDYLPWKLRYGIPIDEAISMWMRKHPARLQCAYTHPSLVDHNDELPTTIVHRASSYLDEVDDRDEPRHAWLTGKREVWDSSSYIMRRPSYDYRQVVPR